MGRLRKHRKLKSVDLWNKNCTWGKDLDVGPGRHRPYNEKNELKRDRALEKIVKGQQLAKQMMQQSRKRKRQNKEPERPAKKRKTKSEGDAKTGSLVTHEETKQEATPQFDEMQAGESFRDFSHRVGLQTRDRLRKVGGAPELPESARHKKQKEYFRLKKERKKARKNGIAPASRGDRNTDTNEDQIQQDDDDEEDAFERVDVVRFGEVAERPPDLRPLKPKFVALQAKLGLTPPPPVKVHSDFKSKPDSMAYELLQQQVRESYKAARQRKLEQKMTTLQTNF